MVSPACSPFVSALRAIAMAATGSVSLEITVAAEAQSAASPTMPDPAPTSRTRFPATSGALSMTYRATACPPAQGKAQ